MGLEKEELEPHIKAEMDTLLSRVFMEGDEQLFHQIYYLIANENVSGNGGRRAVLQTRPIDVDGLRVTYASLCVH